MYSLEFHTVNENYVDATLVISLLLCDLAVYIDLQSLLITRTHHCPI